MKMKATMLVVAFGTLGFFQALAQSPTGPTQGANATVTEKAQFAKEMPKMVTPLNLPQTQESTTTYRLGGTSSQSWPQIVEREHAKQGFPNNQTPEPKFDLLAINFGARH